MIHSFLESILLGEQTSKIFPQIILLTNKHLDKTPGKPAGLFFCHCSKNGPGIFGPNSVVSLKCHEVVFALYNLSNMSQLAVDAHLRTSH